MNRRQKKKKLKKNAKIITDLLKEKNDKYDIKSMYILPISSLSSVNRNRRRYSKECIESIFKDMIDYCNKHGIEIEGVDYGKECD